MVTVTSLGKAALELVFPSRCAGCGLTGTFLCEVCQDRLTPALPPRCSHCWEPLVRGDDCRSCRLHPPAFDALRTAYVYEGLARDLVQALKYRGQSALAADMGRLLAQAACRSGIYADIAVPVPLSGLRHRTRGYNQAGVLARSLGRSLGLAVVGDALARRRNTAPQARGATAEARRANVSGAFVAKERSVAGQAVLLIDDVATTGATLSACAGALKQAGAASVWALAFARED